MSLNRLNLTHGRTLQLAAKFRDLAVEDISHLRESLAKSQLLDIAAKAVDRNS